MLAIKTHFDGKKIAIPKELRNAPPGEVLVVFDRSPAEDDDRSHWLKSQEAAFAKVWENDEDAIYDTL